MTARPAAEADRSDAILRERARELAQAREEESADVRVILPFEVAGDRYAVEVTRIHQVLDSRRVHPLLGAPRGVIGAIVARTRPVPVLDLRHVLGLEGGGLSDLQRVVVLDDEGDLFGLAVERVGRRIEIPVADLRPPETGPFAWVTPDRRAVLDPSRLGVAERDRS
ncbi:chemotaxis protein CheW [Anaeromyxobacter terrae]|uniref:chemotaxis protein CheW n=1 Tax=Anaeromyxobacter terrae TaxID=2925406 RepID=UPI001F580627|nr:chemotaxis protein CheW [Anaeromyxobacter sp. SG22]